MSHDERRRTELDIAAHMRVTTHACGELIRIHSSGDIARLADDIALSRYPKADHGGPDAPTHGQLVRESLGSLRCVYVSGEGWVIRDRILELADGIRSGDPCPWAEVDDDGELRTKPMSTITEIIARLGHACGLPWARCRGMAAVMRDRHDEPGEPTERCMLGRGHDRRCRFDAETWAIDRVAPRPLPPTLAEWQAEHVHEHPGEPAPVASWTSEDGRVSWSVSHNWAQGIVVHVDILGVAGIASAVKLGDSEPSFTGAGLASMAECVRLMQAADGGG